MLGNKSYIDELQSKDLKQTTEVTLNAVDLNWLGFSRRNTKKGLELYGVDAHINRALLWLAGKSLDYVRESSKSGVLQEFVGKSLEDANLSEWEVKIRKYFNAEFANDLDLVYLKLQGNKMTKDLKIEMIVRDAITNRVFPISTGVNLNA